MNVSLVLTRRSLCSVSCVCVLNSCVQRNLTSARMLRFNVFDSIEIETKNQREANGTNNNNKQRKNLFCVRLPIQIDLCFVVYYIFISSVSISLRLVVSLNKVYI